MAESFIPLFFDWTEVTQELNDQEKGRLVDAMMLYARGEDWQERIKGNERYVFPMFKRMIDKSNLISAKRAEIGSVGGYQKAANRSKTQQTVANDSKTQQSVANRSKTQQTVANPTEEEKEEEEEKEKETVTRARAEDQRFDRFWAAYPRKVGKGDAKKAFGKIAPSEALTDTMIRAVEAAKKTTQWQRENGRFVPNPSTWLNQQRWEDEIEETPQRNWMEERGIEDWD